jgi:hypothetical protein
VWQLCRVPYCPGSPTPYLPPMSSNYSKFKKSTTDKEKSHARQITIGHSICFVLPCTDSNLRPFTAVVRHFKPPLPRCARSDLPILTHVHPSFGHEQAMRVYQASLLLPSIISPPYQAFRWVKGVQEPPLNSPRPKTLVLFTSYQKAILEIDKKTMKKQDSCTLR